MLWSEEVRCQTDTDPTDGGKLIAADFIAQVEEEVLESYHASQDASWAYYTDITDEHRMAMEMQNVGIYSLQRPLLGIVHTTRRMTILIMT